MIDANIFDNKTYKLASILDLYGNNKMEGSRNDQDMYRYWAGCYTNNIRIVNRHYLGNTYECLSAHFIADADGNHADRNLRTSPIQKIEPGTGSVIVYTSNSIYKFVEQPLPQPEIRKASNLIELWFGSGDYMFDKGVHYDADGTPHILTVDVHIGTMRDSYLVCRQDNPHITPCRYFIGYKRIEWYKSLPDAQGYNIPMLIHNTANYALTVEFQLGGVEHVIEPGGELLIHPPKRRK